MFSSIICLWNSPYYTHSKRRSLNNSKVLCLYIVTSSRQIQVLFRFFVNTVQGHAHLCKFMQYYTSLLLLFFYSLSRVFSTSLIVQNVLLFLFLLVVQGVLLSWRFGPVQVFVWRRHLLANKFKACRVASRCHLQTMPWTGPKCRERRTPWTTRRKRNRRNGCIRIRP